MHNFSTAIRAINTKVLELSQERLPANEFDLDSLCLDWRSASESQLLESMSACVFLAGMKTRIVATKWLAIRSAFCYFDVKTVSGLQLNKVLEQQGIIRHAQKCQAIINNARKMLAIIQEHGSFTAYLAKHQGRGLSALLAIVKRDFSYMGPATSRDWVKDIGLDTFKPDVHVTRILSRLGWRFESTGELSELIGRLSAASGYSQKQIDRMLYRYGSGHKLSYAVCGTTPKCEVCPVQHCEFAGRK